MSLELRQATRVVLDALERGALPKDVEAKLRLGATFRLDWRRRNARGADVWELFVDEVSVATVLTVGAVHGRIRFFAGGPRPPRGDR